MASPKPSNGGVHPGARGWRERAELRWAAKGGSSNFQVIITAQVVDVTVSSLALNP